MSIKLIDSANKTISVAVPLTKGKEKIRIKKRTHFNQYGDNVATKSEPFSQNCYIEWQIGYDVVVSETEKLKLTTLKDNIFTGANGKVKTLYELSEYIYYFHKWGVVSRDELLVIKNFLTTLNETDFIDNPMNFSIDRSHPVEKNVLGMNFIYTQVKYPLLIYKFQKYEILTEVKITEKQYAIGVQPMLYLCFPITELLADEPLLGRTAKIKETGEFLITRKNIFLFVEMLKIFGMLSSAHCYDIQEIITKVLE